MTINQGQLARHSFKDIAVYLPDKNLRDTMLTPTHQQVKQLINCHILSLLHF